MQTPSSSAVAVGLVASRLLLATATSATDYLIHDHQLSSPLTSFRNLQEGIYLFNHGINPYSGGVFRHSPLYLSLFATVLPSSKTFASILWTFCDVVGAWALVKIWHARQNVSSTPRDGLIAASYLLNPYLVLPSLALSTSSLENTLTLLSVMFAAQGRASAALLLMAVQFHLSLSTLILIPPLLMLLISTPASSLALPKPFTGSTNRLPALIIEFTAYALGLTAASTLVCNGFSWVPQTWGATLTLPDLTPNPGLWWYFFTEMFDHFRDFFLMVFSVHLLIYVAPVCVKFQYDPLFATFVLAGVLGIFKAYPTLSDPGLFISMISLFPEIYPHLRHPLVTALLHLHAALLLPLFHQLWLMQGTGNANFFYASTLVFACGNGAALIDCVRAGLRLAIGKEVEGMVVIQE
ncbi:PIG-U-domain-containing protein [Cylindrobasidium torrendii FP15055 ss-10]|uniref:PIG-U-domain-containing protein n=1 Tax=Cylindrobasidium torrendii FP15055 ss-10 TaxID=1314674 RepID=A0A0D7BLY8_9AGAR|nr:PIG-U-domain-containing protein [Cylindrobasidium torrendii FP15055 ss-10]